VEERDKNQDATRAMKRVFVRVIGYVALVALAACVQIAGITKPTLLDENAAGAGGDGGNSGAGGDGGNVNTGGSGNGATTSSSSVGSSSGSMPCNNSGECPQDTPCENWSCMMGMCSSTFSLMGTVVNDPTNGDCKANVCDGNGNVITSNDDTDVPPGDGNSCTNEGCNNGTPMTTNDPVGTTCPGGTCNNMGICVECVNNADCTVGTSPSCFQETCISCSDGMMNGDETGVDCGGTSCAKKCDGGACATANECKSNFCADGVCCDNACTGTCKSCNLAATIGTCTNIPFGMTDAAPACNGTNVCNGAGLCKLKDGEACASNLDCASNKCTGMPKFCVP
jgi:hypothetical protein